MRVAIATRAEGVKLEDEAARGMGEGSEPAGDQEVEPAGTLTEVEFASDGCGQAARALREAGRGVGRGRDGSLVGRPRSNRVSLNWRGSPDPPATRVCGCSRSRPSMPRIPRRPRWSVACARTRAPAPMRRCGWLSIGWRSRLRWTPPPRRCSYRRWPCCSRTGSEEVVAKAARKATLQAGLGLLSAARGGCHHPAASSSLMRLRLRLWVARTDAR
jgi:hypothetical protein